MNSEPGNIWTGWLFVMHAYSEFHLKGPCHSSPVHFVSPTTRPQSLWNLKYAKKLHKMTKSEIQNKQTCLLSIIFEVASSRDQLWEKLLGSEQFSKILISIRFNLLQFCPSVASVVSVMLF